MRVTFYKTKIFPGDVDVMTSAALTAYLKSVDDTAVSIEFEERVLSEEFVLWVHPPYRSEGWNYAAVTLSTVRYCYYVGTVEENVLQDGAPTYDANTCAIPLRLTLDWRHTAPLEPGVDRWTGGGLLARSHLLEGLRESFYESPRGRDISSAVPLAADEGWYIIGCARGTGSDASRVFPFIHYVPAGGSDAATYLTVRAAIERIARGIRAVKEDGREIDVLYDMPMYAVQASLFIPFQTYNELPHISLVFVDKYENGNSVEWSVRKCPSLDRFTSYSIDASKGALIGVLSRLVELKPRPVPYNVVVQVKTEALTATPSVVMNIEGDVYDLSQSLAVGFVARNDVALAQQRTSDTVGIVANAGGVVASVAALAAGATGAGAVLGAVSLVNSAGSLISSIASSGYRTASVTNMAGAFARDSMLPYSVEVNGADVTKVAVGSLFVVDFRESEALAYEREYFGALGALRTSAGVIPSRERLYLQGDVNLLPRDTGGRVRVLFSLWLPRWRDAIRAGVRICTTAGAFK